MSLQRDVDDYFLKYTHDRRFRVSLAGYPSLCVWSIDEVQAAERYSLWIFQRYDRRHDYGVVEVEPPAPEPHRREHLNRNRLPNPRRGTHANAN